MVKFMRRLRGDIFSVRSLINSGTRFMNAYEKNKRKMLLTGVLLATTIVTTVGRFVPRVAKALGKRVGRKRRKVGRGVEVPEQKEGTMQENVDKKVKELDKEEEQGRRRRKSVQYTQPVKERRVGRMRQVYEKGEELVARLHGEDTVLRGEELRLMGQVVGACKEFNTQNHSLKVTYTLVGKDMLVDIQGSTLTVTSKGIYSMSGTEYYKYGKTDPNVALNRMVLDYDVKYINLLVGLLMSYSKDLFGEEYQGDVKKLELAEQKEKEKKEREKELEERFTFKSTGTE